MYEILKVIRDKDLSNGDWSPEVKEMFISALKADVTHLLLKDKKDS